MGSSSSSSADYDEDGKMGNLMQGKNAKGRKMVEDCGAGCKVWSTNIKSREISRK